MRARYLLMNLPGSVAEMSEPNRSDGTMDSLNPSGTGKVVRLATSEPGPSAPLTA